MLNTDEYVLTNPAVRLASQGGSVAGSDSGSKTTKTPIPLKLSSTNAGASCAKLQEQNQKAEDKKPAAANSKQ